MSAISYATSDLQYFSLDQLSDQLEPELGRIIRHEKYLLVRNELHSVNRIIDVVNRIGFAPIISSNRLDGRICFTVVPHVGPAFFAKDRIEAPEGMRGDALWGPISVITSLDSKGAPVIWREKEYRDRLAYWGAFAEFASDVQIPHPTVVEAMDKYPTAGAALDIGAGKGTEAIELSKRGWQVTVIENSQEVIDVFDRICLKIPQAWLMRVDRCCISEFEFPEARYNLVVAYDVLPYVDFSKMESIFKKTSKSLLSGGRFVGTFFFAKPGDPICETRRLNGIHLLPDPRMAPAMLEDVGLVVETMRYRYFSNEPHPEVVEFSAVKL